MVVATAAAVVVAVAVVVATGVVVTTAAAVVIVAAAVVARAGLSKDLSFEKERDIDWTDAVIELCLEVIQYMYVYIIYLLSCCSTISVCAVHGSVTSGVKTISNKPKAFTKQ